jgi:hypothetical protein
VPVPQLRPENEEELRHFEDAGRRRELRQREQERKRAGKPAEMAVQGSVRPGRTQAF